VIGAAFGKIVSSLVTYIIMPPIGKVTGGVDFKDLFINLDPGKLTKAGAPVKTLADATDAGAAVIAYGAFIDTLIAFVIVAFCIFLVVKGMNRLTKKPVPVVPAAPPEPTKEEKLLTEIRDAIRAKT
jgi:large conductance mechanosensitive channel